ncbi:MAG: hypothetical protein JWM60_2991 [Solirubrobacterales bacterium]|nr:hypothetical protein [Solirubrobacterales bacterium]
MSISAETPGLTAVRAAGRTTDTVLRAGLVVFAVYHLALAAFMVLAPHAFYTSIGPFDAYNSHYIRDTATFEAALGVGFTVAISRPAWRVPVLAITTVQFALHTINHLIDADSSHPAWTGWFDFGSLLAATGLLLVLLARARSASLDSPERSTP